MEPRGASAALPVSPSVSVHEPSSVAVLITVVASTASVLLALTCVHGLHRVEAHPLVFFVFLAVTAALQLVAVEVYGRGTVSFSSCGILALGMYFGVGTAMAAAASMVIILILVRRPKLHRAVFDAANYALAAAAGTVVYQLFSPAHWSTVERLGPALLAGIAYGAVNVGLLSVAMGLSEGIAPRLIWMERFRWRTPYNVVAGPLALALIVSYDKLRITGVIAFTLPPLMMMISVRQYTNRTQRSVEEVRQANEDLQRANTELAARNADLRDLFEFAGGLSAQTHDPTAVKEYVESALGRLVGARVEVSLGSAVTGQTPLESRGRLVGGLRLEGGDSARWSRLREAIEPHLATTLESVSLVEEVRKTHLETIAALSRSMEAKDYYTGGHTERVSGIAVSLARRLGYGGADLDAIEIGALLHDIGKIGIPERILHKQGPLDDEEWTLMKQHPVISEFILSGVNLPRIVLEIARHSHERMDGRGYPDGLAGDEIPMAARIVLVADAWDALTSDRPYRRARDAAAALDELLVHSGTQFCPQVVAAMEHVYREDPAVLASPGRLAVVA